MKGKWATGIAPRNFTWIIKGRLAVSERPGGYARNHRKVRRQEEIIWLREQGFARVVSLLESPHNLHAYDELGVKWTHVPFPFHEDPRPFLSHLYADLKAWLSAGEKVLIHQEELGDHLMGVAAGFLLHVGLLESGPQAITALEHVTQKQMGPPGREVVAAAASLTRPS